MNEIKKEILLSTLVIFLSYNGTFAQGIWVQKANFAGAERDGAVGFSIGTMGYIGIGYGQSGYLYDFWQWNQNTNAWTQQSSFGGTANGYAVGFSIDTNGYIGTGEDGIVNNIFWEWNQSTNTWTQKNNFGGAVRSFAVGFTIGNKAYIGTGSQSGSPLYKDFWEWDQATNTWTQKADFGGTPRDAAVAFSIGTKGYIGTGRDSVNGNFRFRNDFWEWDQNSNTWTQKANFGGSPRFTAVGFSIGQMGYIGTGEDSTYAFKNDFWEWDQNTNTWTRMSDFGGAARRLAVGFSIGNKGYIGTGEGSVGYTPDFWEYTPSCSSDFSLIADTTQSHHYIATNFATGIPPLKYDWSWGDGSSDDTIPYPSHTYADSGFYTICLSITDSTGCQSTYCDSSFHATRTTNTMVYVDVVNSLILGSTEINLQTKQINLYPNPATDKLIINRNGTSENATITIFNIAGEIVYVKEIIHKQEIINCKLFTSGIYFLEMKSDNGTLIKKFVKE